jgi:hypothetical protein
MGSPPAPAFNVRHASTSRDAAQENQGNSNNDNRRASLINFHAMFARVEPSWSIEWIINSHRSM